jgi:Ala-tRNA(Pro) deacylase
MPASPDDLLARLHQLGFETETYEHPPLFTVEESKALRGRIPGGHCKSLFLKDKRGQLWLVVALEDTPIELNRLHARLGAARLSFGSADLLEEVLGVKPGAVTPFALINDTERRVRVVLDSAMMDYDLLNYHPLSNDRTTTIRSRDLLAFIEACGHNPLITDVGAVAA